MGSRTDALPAAIPLSDNDLLPLEQSDSIDRKASLLALRTWLAARLSPSLAVGPFYVDAVAGSDAADGLSIATAKKTIYGAITAMPVGARAVVLLKNAQTHQINANPTMKGLSVTLSSWDGADHRADTFIEMMGAMSVGNTFQSNYFIMSESVMLIQNVTFKTLSAQALLSAYPAATPGAVASFFAFSGSSSALIFFTANLVFQDCELFVENSDSGFAKLAFLTCVKTISQSALGAALNRALILTPAISKPLSIAANGVTLPAGKTWKAIIGPSSLNYGGDLGPRNVVHNLGNALDSNQS